MLRLFVLLKITINYGFIRFLVRFDRGVALLNKNHSAKYDRTAYDLSYCQTLIFLQKSYFERKISCNCRNNAFQAHYHRSNCRIKIPLSDNLQSISNTA